jgi:hypothetical protein
VTAGEVGEKSQCDAILLPLRRLAALPRNSLGVPSGIQSDPNQKSTPSNFLCSRRLFMKTQLGFLMLTVPSMKLSIRTLLFALMLSLMGTAAASAAMIVDNFDSPGTADYVVANSGLVQSGLTDNVPDNTRRVFNLQYNGTFSNLESGAGILTGNNFGGSSSWFSDYGHLITGNMIGDLTTGAQDSFRLVIRNDFPDRGNLSYRVVLFNTSVAVVGDSGYISLPNIAGYQTNDILYTAVAPLATFSNVATVRLEVFGTILTDYSQFTVDTFQTYSAVPEPSSLVMLAFGSVFMLCFARRRTGK